MLSFRFKTLRQIIVGIIFLTLFPGFFAYHTAIGAGLFPAVLGGFFSPIAAISFFPLILFYLQGLKKREFGGLNEMIPDIAFWMFILYFLTIVCFNFFNNSNKFVILTHLVAVLHFLVCFLVFRLADFSDRRLFALNIAAIILMAITVIYLSSDGAYYRRQIEEDEEEFVAGYQAFARSFLLTILMVLPFLESKKWRLITYLLGSITLFLIGARSEFVAMLLTALTLEINSSKYRFIVVFTIFFSAVSFFMFLDDIANILPDNRVLQLLNIDNANSWQDRKELTLDAWKTVQHSPIFGDYAGYAGAGDAKNFAHNILSAWVDLGLLGFLGMLAMLGIPFARLSRKIVRRGIKDRTSDFVIAFSSLFVTVFLLLTAKNFLYMMVGVSMGAYARHLTMQQINRRNANLR